MKKYLAEMVGTMVLVLMGCGVAVSLGCDPVDNIPAVVGTAFAFGLSVVAMAYTFKDLLTFLTNFTIFSAKGFIEEN